MTQGARPSGAESTREDAIVYVIDDDPLMLGALSCLLRSIGLRVEVFSAAQDLLHRPLPAVPSCLVTDIRMPRFSGFDLQAELSRLGIEMPTIFITGHGDVPMSVKAMKSGAVDFLTKPFRDQDLIEAVTTALNRDRKRRSEEASKAEVRARFALLTARERQVMALVTGGLMNKQVAGRLEISEMTVKIHRGNVMRKMKVKSLADLVLFAEGLGIRPQGKPDN